MANFNFAMHQKSLSNKPNSSLLLRKVHGFKNQMNRTPVNIYNSIYSDIQQVEKLYLEKNLPILTMIDKQIRSYHTNEPNLEAIKALSKLKKNIIENGKFKENQNYLNSVKNALERSVA
jgi:hypothetical protein